MMWSDYARNNSLYTNRDIEVACKKARTLDFHEGVELGDGLKIACY